MALRELYKKYKIYTIVGLIVLIMLVAGGTTAGVLLTKQDKEQINNIANAAVGDEFTVGNLIYAVLTRGATNTVEVYATTSTSISGSITIPSTVTNGVITYTVTEIGNRAFQSCSGLTSITIPDSVTSISGYAFEDCSSLTSITIPEGVTSIDGSAFNGCSNLTEVTIPNSVTSIGSYAFYGCRSLNNVYFYNDISTNTSSIDSLAFRNNASTVTYWVKNQISLTNIQAIYNDDNTKFTSDNFQVMPAFNVTITTDANLGQVFVNGSFTTNTTVEITQGLTISNIIAVPKQNSAFLYWLVTTSSGTTQLPDNPLSMSITEDTTITAVFTSSLMDGIGVTALGGGQVRMGGYIDDGDPNTTVVLNAICYSGWTFDGWYTMENGVLTKIDALGNSTAVTINVADYDGKLIIASFVPNSNGNVNEDLNNS